MNFISFTMWKHPKKKNAEPMRGIEPLTFSLPRKRSTPELHRLYSQWFMTKSGCTTQKYKHPIFSKERFRAEDGIRTRGPQLGRLMLYQLSYFRFLSIPYIIKLRSPTVGGAGFEPAKVKPTDLQSVIVGRLSIPQ
jgi:hypothetical protein